MVSRAIPCDAASRDLTLRPFARAPHSILIFTISAANSDQYIASRTLYGMAKDGNAPRIFTKCTKRGVPWVAFVFTAMFMGLAYLVASSDALVIFNYFVSSVTIFGSLTWVSSRVRGVAQARAHADAVPQRNQISILSSHIGFMRGLKTQGISRDTLPYKAVSSRLGEGCEPVPR
jgi:amino acid transporter